MENTSEIACVACGGNTHQFYGEKDGYRLFRCAACQHMLVWPLPAATGAVYSEDYFAGAHGGFGYVDYDEDKEPMRAVFETSLAEAEAWLGKPGQVLDVGAATGFLLAIARSRGWQTAGVEISDFAAEQARSKGLAVQTGTLRSVTIEAESFDLITMWDVIEHVEEPAADLSRAYQLLKKGGVVFINTPDAGSFWARMLGSRWNAVVPPEHLHYFNRKSLSLLLERLGFDVIAVGTQRKVFTLEYVAHTASRWLSLQPLSHLANWLHKHPRLGMISIPLNLRDNMYLVARKR